MQLQFSGEKLFSTTKLARGKHSRYDEIARINGYQYRMIPFVVSFYGGIGAEVLPLLHRMAAQEYAPRELFLHAHHRLSVALQSSNVDITQLELRLQQRVHSEPAEA